MASLPVIPVRFKENIEDQFMDLADVINLHKNKGARVNPFNWNVVNLGELHPAYDKLDKISEHFKKTLFL